MLRKAEISMKRGECECGEAGCVETANTMAPAPLSNPLAREIFYD